MRITLDSFRTVIRQSDLVDREVLDQKIQEFDQAVASEAASQGEPARADAKRFAQFLVEQEVLSVWQAENLLKGKHKGFRLGKYRLISLLGKGGMSSVYLAEHTVMKRRVAIKVLPHKKVNDASYLGRFHREAQAVAALDHPNIVRAYDVDAETDGNMEIHFLVMEYVEGKSLQEFVARRGPLEPRQAAEFIEQAAEGLEHAHAAGLVHRDIKPGNLLVDKKGTVKLLDLGLARFFNEDENSLTVEHDEKVLGTADYLAPEQAVDSHSVDHRADLYSLGCTLYFLLTGEPPFNQGSLAQRLIAHQTKEPPSVTEKRSDVPESLIALMKRLMSKKPEDRPATAADAAREFNDWLQRAETEATDGEPQENIIDSQEEAEEPVDALGSFLSQLDSAPMLASSVEVASSSRVGLVGDSSPGTTAGGSSTTSGPSSNVHGRGPSSVIARKKTNTMQTAVIGGVVVAVLLIGVLIWAMSSGNDTGTPSTGSSQQIANDSGTTPDNTTAETRPPVTGDIVTVGAKGNFGTIDEAIRHVVKTFTPFDSSEKRTIELAAGETFEETVQLGSSGLDLFPKYVTITTDESNPATLRGDGLAPPLSIDSATDLSIQNLVVDAAGARIAVDVRGYAIGTTIRNVVVRGFSGIGIELTGAAGLSGQPIRLESVKVQSPADRTPLAGIKLVAAIPTTGLIRIDRCQIQGSMTAGLEVVGTSSDVTVVRTVFDGPQQGVSFSGAAPDFNKFHVIGCTFHNVKTGLMFNQQPAGASKKLAVAQSLFTNVEHELLVQSGFKKEPFAKLFSEGGWYSENFSTRSKPNAPTSGEFLVVSDAGFGLSSADYVSTDRASSDYLKPKASQLRTAKGGPQPKHIGAIAP